MARTVILIYTTNAWLQFSSRELIGAATTEKQRDRLVRKYLREEVNVKLSRKVINEALRHINQFGQTQSLSELIDEEIDTETLDLNQLCV